MESLKNPILKGFNPDPSILRVGDDYYIATSTFEWFPGVMIYHSNDLSNWELVARPLDRKSQLNMSGNPSSGGIWAPCLSYDNGTFYLIYTDVKVKSGIFKDTHNYMVTASDIKGVWSEPIYLNSSGFDPSLLHDDDGKKYLLNMLWDHRPWKNSFAGIVMQEYSFDEKKLVGEIKNIFSGTELGRTEGPHIYKKNGYYYLMLAEGGTGWSHAVTIARSRSIDGPYEVDTAGPMLTSYDDPNLLLQKAGHASLIETPDGDCYIAHLCSRPIPIKKRSVMGRETALQKVVWSKDGWLRLAEGGHSPRPEVIGLLAAKIQKISQFDDFDADELDINFQTLRIPLDEDILSLKERPGYLTLKGKESLSSHHVQSLVARRQQSFSYTSSTCLEFEPVSFQQMAGLICMYDTINYYYLHVSHDDEIGKCLNILVCDNGEFRYPLAEPICIEGEKRCYLKADVNHDELYFSYSLDGAMWNRIDKIFDYSTLSDEYFKYIKQGRFTGAFVGMCCQDISGRSLPAHFDYFEYVEG